MRTLFVFILLLLAFATADSKNLLIHFKDGNKTIVPLEDIIKITFDSERSVAENTNDVFKLDLKSYPNPFQNSVKINYQTIAAGEVNIELFNLIGEKIKTISEGFLPAGNHEFLLNDKDLESYNNFTALICRVSCNKATGTTKLIKLK